MDRSHPFRHVDTGAFVGLPDAVDIAHAVVNVTVDILAVFVGIFHRVVLREVDWAGDDH